MQTTLLYYGKLPAFGDFVRYNASLPEIQWFDQWIQEGLYISQKRLNPAGKLIYASSPVYNFLLSFQDTETFVTGLMKPSNDKVGRKFPFIVALRIPDSILRPDYKPLLPVMYRSFYTEAYSFAEAGSSGTTSEDLQERAAYMKESVMLDEIAYRRYCTTLRNTSAVDFLTDIWDTDNGNEKNLFMNNIISMGKYIREHDPDKIDFGFRFPLDAKSHDAHTVASYWIQLFYSYFNKRSFHPFIFWDTSNMFYFTRQPSPGTLTCMIQPDRRGQEIYVMDSDGVHGDNEHNTTGQLAGILTGNKITLDRLLEAVGK